MNFVAFVIGVALPTLTGWALLRSIEGNAPVLGRVERWAAGAALGITLTMWLAFVAHVTVGLPFSRLGFAGVELLALAACGGFWLWRKPSGQSPVLPASDPRPWWEVIVWVLLAFSVAKVIVAATTFLLLTPTYLDDTLDNWNLRGKVYFEDQTLTLVMPGEDPVTSPKGVSSYPPAVPLFKASLAAFAGEWTDPLINAPHALWFALSTVLLYAAVRKRLARRWALLAAYAYLAMPLATMHGTNPYADVFVSVHVFLAASWTLDAVQERDPARMQSRFLLLGLAFAALSFTKNEGIVLYLPPLVLILLVAFALRLRAKTIDVRAAFFPLLRAALPLLVVALPWLIFKWSNGLTFGNAKAFSDFSIYWRENVLLSVAINTFLEGNWLLLFPLLFGLLAWRWRTAWHTYLPLSAFLAIVYIGQLLIFLFTDLAVEALMQTGYARGLIQLLPCIVLLTTLLLENAVREEDLSS